jgi:hypothetical protein
MGCMTWHCWFEQSGILAHAFGLVFLGCGVAFACLAVGYARLARRRSAP